MSLYGGNKMKKFYYSKEEMLKDAELESRKILADYNSTVKESKKSKKKVIFIILIGIILFKVIIGTIELNSPFEYSKNRLYEITINDKPVTYTATDHHRVFIIPYFLYWNSYHLNTYYGIDYDAVYYINPEESEYILNVESYSCYSKNKERQIECQVEDNFYERKNHDTVYTNLYIRKNGKPEKEMYDGKFIKNITPYINEKGIYYVRVDAEYENVSSKLEFFLKQK